VNRAAQAQSGHHPTQKQCYPRNTLKDAKAKLDRRHWPRITRMEFITACRWEMMLLLLASETPAGQNIYDYSGLFVSLAG
jgi:hypothetical protein